MDLNTLRAVAHSYIDQAIIEAVTVDDDGDPAVHFQTTEEYELRASNTQGDLMQLKAVTFVADVVNGINGGEIAPDVWHECRCSSSLESG